MLWQQLPAQVRPLPPSQQPPAALVAAARASLDEFEMQDDRGEKRDAHAHTPPPAAAPERPPPRRATEEGSPEGGRRSGRTSRRRPSSRRAAAAHRHHPPRRRPRRRRPQPQLCLRRAPRHAYRPPTPPVAARDGPALAGCFDAIVVGTFLCKPSVSAAAARASLDESEMQDDRGARSCPPR